MLADNSNDSPIDILKHTAQGQMTMDELVSTDLEGSVELPSSGVRFFQTNLVTQTINYSGVTGLTALAYVHFRARWYFLHQPRRTE